MQLEKVLLLLMNFILVFHDQLTKGEDRIHTDVEVLDVP